jgi:hypothetical protein
MVVSETSDESTADLDQARVLLAAPPDVLARLFEMTEALARHRRIDPELRRRLLHVAEKFDPALVEQLALELDAATPAAVLEAHAHELIPDLPALGAFPRRDTLEAPTVGEWLKENPRRLRGVVLESCRFCQDDRRVVEGALQLAKDVGIELRLAGDIIGPALRDARQPSAMAK